MFNVFQSPDFDINQVFFNVTIIVSDGDSSHDARAYVEVTVVDVNDNAPNITLLTVLDNGNFSEGIQTNTLIASFVATDIDSNENKDFK